MRLEIAERLRCARAHAPTPLVLIAERVVERELVEGMAGCAVCLREARIHDGDVQFDGPVTATAPLTRSGGVEPPVHRDALDRLRAQLLLGEPDVAVLLTGRYARFAAPLVEALDVAVVLMEAAPIPAPAVSHVRLAEAVVPFSDHTFRAAALDRSLTPELAADAVRSVAVGGRVVGSAALPLPPLLRELARDQHEWLAEREAGPGGVVRIRRA